jgi:prefoldin subunit 5
MISKKTFARAIQTEIEREDMEIYDELKDKCSNIEDENEALNKKMREKERKIAQIQSELDAKTQEVNILIKQGASVYTPNASVASSL